MSAKSSVDAERNQQTRQGHHGDGAKSTQMDRHDRHDCGLIFALFSFFLKRDIDQIGTKTAENSLLQAEIK